MKRDDDLHQCAAAMIRRHGARATEFAQICAEAHFALDEPETGAFWAALAELIQQKIGSIQ
jgi:hypothetical protein